MTTEIIAERSGDVLRITLNRPEALNAITPAMVARLGELLDEAAEDGTRVIVLTGAGRGFCAGADLLAVGADPAGSTKFLGDLQALLVRIAGFPMPVIAAVNGTAMGGGTELILAADFAIAAESAKVGDGHTNVGVIPGGGGATILPQRVPLAIAKYVVYTGDRLTAQQWLQYGLFAEVVPDAELLERVGVVADRLAAKSPLGLREIKGLMSHGPLDHATGLALELEANSRYATSEDMAEGLAAFAEKRPPRFTGR